MDQISPPLHFNVHQRFCTRRCRLVLTAGYVHIAASVHTTGSAALDSSLIDGDMYHIADVHRRLDVDVLYVDIDIYFISNL